MFRPGGIEPMHGVRGVQTLPYRCAQQGARAPSIAAAESCGERKYVTNRGHDVPVTVTHSTAQRALHLRSRSSGGQVLPMKL